MHIHILGACGTFMGGVALLAKRAGHRDIYKLTRLSPSAVAISFAVKNHG